jgi:hypothetical protein
MKNFNLNIPDKSLLYLLVCLGIIVLVILAGMYPLYRYNTKQKMEIKRLSREIEEQKTLLPLYETLLKSREKKNLSDLPNPQRTPILREEANKFQDAFRLAVGKAGMMTVALTPDLSTLSGTSNYFLHSATVKGEFKNYRELLIELAKIPYINQIEEIQIHQYADSLEFKMKIWILLGK